MGSNLCVMVRYVSGARQSHAMGNPFYEKYSKIPGRVEPKDLRPHQIEFIIQKGFLPPPGFHLSHVCGATNSSCINVEHMSVEPIKINNSRKTCHRAIRRAGRKTKNKRGVYYCVNCPHWPDYPKCFINFGLVE